MEDVVTVQKLTAKLSRLDSIQKQIVDEFVTFLLSKQRALKPGEAKRLLLQTSVWTDEEFNR